MSRKGIPLKGFSDIYSLNAHTKIADTDSYKQGKLYGLELGSIFCVKALDIQPNENVLEMCCAPGAKLLFMKDIIDSQKSSGMLIGNDISLQRLKITKNMLKKYNLDKKMYLVNGDARDIHLDFNLKNLTKTEDDLIYTQNEKPCKSNKNIIFDKVLVDVECSHDGSFKHILKYLNTKSEKNKKKNKSIKPIVLSNREQKRRMLQKSQSGNQKSNTK